MQLVDDNKIRAADVLTQVDIPNLNLREEEKAEILSTMGEFEKLFGEGLACEEKIDQEYPYQTGLGDDNSEFERKRLEAFTLCRNQIQEKVKASGLPKKAEALNWKYHEAWPLLEFYKIGDRKPPFQ